MKNVNKSFKGGLDKKRQIRKQEYDKTECDGKMQKTLPNIEESTENKKNGTEINKGGLDKERINVDKKIEVRQRKV